MIKRVLALFLALTLLCGMVPTAFAADQTSENAGIRIVEESCAENILVIKVQGIFPSTSTGVRSAGVAVSYDTTTLTLLNTNGEEVVATETLQSKGSDVVTPLLSTNKNTTIPGFGTFPTPYNVVNGDVYGTNGRACVYVGMGTTDGPSTSQDPTNWLDLFSLKFKVNGNAAEVLNSGSIRIADVEKDAAVIAGAYPANNSYVVSINCDDSATGSPTYKYGKMNGNSSGDLTGVDFYMSHAETATATYTGSTNQPSQGGDEGGGSGTTASAYEIWYELDSNTDVIGEDGAEGADKYMEYDISTDAGKTVTATVKIKNKGSEAINLQAYDIYLTHDEKLAYAGTTLESGVKFNTETANKIHIQAVGDSTETGTASTEEGNTRNPISIALPVGEDVELGTITFTIDAATAEYDEQLHITLVEVETAEGNTDKEVTNIGVGTDDSGNPTSYYPVVTGDVLGAEVNTKHTITWKNDDGSTLKTDTVGHNLMPAYTGEPPTKAATTQYTYTFAGWDPELAKATKDVTYTATYTSTVNEYTVTWKNEDGNVLETDTGVAYGTTPSYNGETPTKAADNMYTYEHAGWEPEISVVTGDATYTATYTPHAKEFKITFNLNDESASLPNGTVNPMPYYANAEITLPKPSLPGYTFNGWLLANTTYGWEAGTYYDTAPVTGKWGDVTLVAQWLDAEFEVTIGESDNGYVTASPTAGAAGESIKLTAYPNAGYKWVSYSVTYTSDPTQTVSVNEDGTFTLPAADVTVTATFELKDLNVTVDEDQISNGTVNADKTTAKLGDTVTLTANPKPGYQLKANSYVVTYTDSNGQSQTVSMKEDGTSFSMPAYDVTIKAEFERAELAITITPNDSGVVIAQNSDSETINTAKVGDQVTLVATPNNGYELAENGFTVTYTVPGENGAEGTTETVFMTGNSFEMPAYPVTVTTTFNAKPYTITFMTNGGSEIAQMTYYVNGTEMLPETTKDNCTFVNWIISYPNNETTGGWGDAGKTVAAKTPVTNHYGNVILTADWDEAINYVVEEYKYAADGYVMLRVADDLGENMVYQFGDGANATMYYMENNESNTSYMIGESTGVYYTLIPATYAKSNVVDGKTVYTGKLTDAGFELLKAVSGQESIIDYTSGNINGDQVTNIADANIVYQMVRENGAYYGDQLTIPQRLAADMNRSADGVHRGSLEDVAAIVAIINGQ